MTVTAITDANGSRTVAHPADFSQQFKQAMENASSDVWDPGYNPDPNDKAGQDLARAIAQEINRNGDPGNGLQALLDLDNTRGLHLTDAQRQQRLEQLIHDLGPDGTAKLIRALGVNATTESQMLSQNPQFQKLLQSTFGKMINDGSFSPQDAARLMDSLATLAASSKLSPQAWNDTAWFTSLLDGVQGPNSAAVKIAAAQELISLAQKEGAGSYARTAESAEASDLLGSAAQDPAGYQPVIDYLNQMERQHQGFMR